MATAPDDSTGLDLILSNLGIALRTRFERTGMLADLDAAVAAGRAAVEAALENSPNEPILQSNLGIALQARFRRIGQLADLDAGVEAGQRALAAASGDDFGRAPLLSNLADALRARFERTGVLADLDAAVEAGRAAVEATPDGHVGRAFFLASLGLVLRTRFERTGDQADLEAAIQVLHSAVKAAPADHSKRAAFLTGLADALRVRLTWAGTQPDLDAACSALEEAAGLTSAAPSARIEAARHAVSLCAGSDPGKAAGLLAGAVRLLSEVAPRQLARGDQEHAIGELAGLASDAAALALVDTGGATTKRQRAEQALVLLEAGRAMLLSQSLDTRNDLTELRQWHPQLAQRFTELRDLLDQPEEAPQPVLSPGSISAPFGRAAEGRRQLAEQFAQTLQEIRKLDGFTSFGLPPEIDELLAQAHSGPVVTFNVSAHRSDALLLTSSGISAVDLPDLTENALIVQINAFRQALPAAIYAAARGERRAAQETMLTSLGGCGMPSPGLCWNPSATTASLRLTRRGRGCGGPQAGCSASCRSMPQVTTPNQRLMARHGGQ